MIFINAAMQIIAPSAGNQSYLDCTLSGTLRTGRSCRDCNFLNGIDARTDMLKKPSVDLMSVILRVDAVDRNVNGMLWGSPLMLESRIRRRVRARQQDDEIKDISRYQREIGNLIDIQRGCNVRRLRLNNLPASLHDDRFGGVAHIETDADRSRHARIELHVVDDGLFEAQRLRR